MYILCMVNLLPTCVKCGSHVADSFETEVEKADQVEAGHYVNSVCHLVSLCLAPHTLY